MLIINNIDKTEYYLFSISGTKTNKTKNTTQKTKKTGNKNPTKNPGVNPYPGTREE
jgi:hypothetical protein